METSRKSSFFKRRFEIQSIKRSADMLFRRTPCPRMKNNTLKGSQCFYLTRWVPLSPSWLRLVFRETNRLIFPAASVQGYWYGPGEPACQLLLNNVTPLSHFHNTRTRARSPTHTDTRGKYKWLKPLYRRVMIVCKSLRGACIRRDQTSWEACVCVCVCCRANAITMTYMKAIYNTMHEAERDKRCVDSGTHTARSTELENVAIYVAYSKQTHLFTQANIQPPTYIL